MKITIFLFYFLNVAFSFSQEKDPIILWDSEYKLKIDDFLGKKGKNEPYLIGASSHVDLSYVPIKNKNNTYSHFVFCFFDRNKSYLVTNKENITLEHEQIHFDITEIYARKLRKKFKELEKKGEKDLSKYKDIYMKFRKGNDYYNDLFDSETSYSADLKEHKRWKLKVKKELLELKKYNK